MSNTFKPIPVSELPESTRTAETYFFGYEPNEPVTKSVKIPFSAIAKASNERRIAVVLDTNETIVPIAEPMTIYKVVCKNVSELTIKGVGASANSTQKIDLDTTNFDLRPYMATDAILGVKKTGQPTDSVIATVYLFVKVLPE